MSIAIDPSITLAELVTRRPALARELERRSLDYLLFPAVIELEAGMDAGVIAPIATTRVGHRHGLGVSGSSREASA